MRKSLRRFFGHHFKSKLKDPDPASTTQAELQVNDEITAQQDTCPSLDSLPEQGNVDEKAKGEAIDNHQDPTNIQVETHETPTLGDNSLGLAVEMLEQSFAVLAPQAETLVARFYEELFNRYPEVKPLFANTSPEDQQQKLLAALKLVVANLRNPDALAQD